MNVLRSIKSLQETLTAFNSCGSSYVSVKKLCTNIERNRKSLFFNEEVQNLLKSLTRIDYEKIFRPRKLGKRYSDPILKFMTDEELEKAREESLNIAKEKLQMPPVLPPRREIDHLYVKDQKLQGFSESKYVFTDITYGKDDRTRHIVVRDIDGTLRKASWEERSRCNEIYFPRAGRKLRTPTMFKPGYFEEVLNKGWFLFILERACLQFEPDDPLYISVTQRTYDAVAETKRFQEFESTRFFGSMIYYFTEQQKLEHLIIYFLTYDRLEDIILVIKLHNVLHPDKMCSLSCSPGQEITVLKRFVTEQYPKSAELELALRSYEDYLNKPKSQAVL